MWLLYPSRIEFGDVALVFVEGGNPENSEKKPSSITRIDNTYIWHRAGIEPRPHDGGGGRRALSTLLRPSLLQQQQQP